jgi:hypothetical protein
MAARSSAPMPSDPSTLFRWLGPSRFEPRTGFSRAGPGRIVWEKCNRPKRRDHAQSSPSPVQSMPLECGGRRHPHRGLDILRGRALR